MSSRCWVRLINATSPSWFSLSKHLCLRPAGEIRRLRMQFYLLLTPYHPLSCLCGRLQALILQGREYTSLIQKIISKPTGRHSQYHEKQKFFPQLKCRRSFASTRTIVNLPRLSVALGNPYVVFFQPTQKDLPLNAPIMSLITAAAARDPPNALPTNVSHIRPWRGNVLVAKYADVPFGEMISCGMNDLPIISSHLRCHEPSGNELDVSRLNQRALRSCCRVHNV